MSLVTLDHLRTSYKSGDKDLKNAIRYAFLGGKDVFDEDLIQRRLKDHLEKLLAHDLGKAVRPWQLVNVSKLLDPKQPWVGIEFETGYRNKEEYEKVINYVWQHHELTAIDAEGCGNYPVEITFSPVNFDDFVSRSYNMDRLLGFMHKKDCRKADHCSPAYGDSDDDDEQVGTHCNISTPAYRKLATLPRGKSEHGPMYKVCALLNHSLGGLARSEKIELFGRQPYGTFFRRGNKYGDWLEGKLFDSTDSKRRWAEYKKTIAVFCELIEELSKQAANGKLPDMYEMSNGKTTNDPNAWWRAQTKKKGWMAYENGEALRIKNLYEILIGEQDVSEMKLIHDSRDDGEGGAEYRDEDRPEDMGRVGESWNGGYSYTPVDDDDDDNFW